MEIEYFKNKRGNCEILDFMASLKDENQQKAILKGLDKLKDYNFSDLLKVQIVEKIGKNLYELRCHYGKTIFRVLFGLIEGGIFVSVVFQKKEQKLKKGEMNLAIKRIKERVNI